MGLDEIGLTKNEEKVYLALLDLGPSLAGTISRKTGLHRRTIYDTTEMLIKKGLIGYILKNNRRVFNATNPTRILEIVNEKKNILEPLVESLQKKYNEEKQVQETNFFKGKAGLKNIFEEQLKYPEILILGASPLSYEILEFYFKWYDKKRKSNKIKTRIIAQDRKMNKIPASEIKYLPAKYSNPVAVNIYGDTTAIILWSTNPLAIVIKNKEITEGYRKYFELMWKIAKK